MQILALVALLLYIGAGAFQDRLTPGQRLWAQRAALGTVAAGVAIALFETIRWLAH
jgi:hypothetical protein